MTATDQHNERAVAEALAAQQRQYLERELPAFCFDDWPREGDLPQDQHDQADSGHSLTQEEASWLD